MHRRRLLQSLVVLMGGAFIAPAHGAIPLTPVEREATATYLTTLRNEEGGYRTSAKAGPSTLADTTSTLRALKLLGVPTPLPHRTLSFVLACRDEASGGFGNTPGAKPDVRSTALGLTALAELRRDGEIAASTVETAVKFLVEQAGKSGEVSTAVAALEASGHLAAAPANWADRLEATRQPDGNYGNGPFANLPAPLPTARAVVTLLRLGRKLADPTATGKQLTIGQQRGGGYYWGSGLLGSDLDTTQEVMRAIFMLKGQPNLKTLHEFVVSCRGKDGGYGVAQAIPSSATATYHALLLLD